MSTKGTRPILVTDFDGTISQTDFYQLVVDRLLPPGLPDYWAEYRAGRLTHFGALAAIFRSVQADESTWDELIHDMGVDPDLADSVATLRNAGWEIIVASAGCGWYIEKLLRRADVSLEVHTNGGRLVDGRLEMELPTGDQFFCPDVGIDKAAIVRDSLSRSRLVAFAGDGPPDVAPALLVDSRVRFARGFLAEDLAARGESFQAYKRWDDVAQALSRLRPEVDPA
jgi:2,3-diketo-5-methylthio-1-phosphopentane phosphatase